MDRTFSLSSESLPGSTRNLRDCPKCGARVRADRLPRHLRRVHRVNPANPARHRRQTNERRGKSGKAQVGALARELGVENWRILAYLFELGLNSNSVGAFAERIREHFKSTTARRKSIETRATVNHVFPSRPPKIQLETLRFQILPPGTWDIGRMIAFYRKADHLPTDTRGGGFDPTRIEKIVGCLHPVKCYRGEEHWHGYHAFEFAESNRVVLECPVRGNATYVLWGDWQSMALHPKQYLWKHFPRNYARIIHTCAWPDWIGRIRTALRLR